ncbi:GNAT family N-acetyltransferase [Desulfobacula sp.]|uniref:GNAT family N-acetyltransferase n=1 Tax=Desulfobacula sp. TaxID=2593537 RepID=UPI002613DB69|nr:GNAT family N-acetyltransferase [Desulfobacula sp.]
MSGDPSTQLIIKPIKSASMKDLIHLYKEAGWWESSYDSQPEFLNYIVKDSALFVGVFWKKKLIGMGRALSDLASDAYIQDVTVLKEFRGKGIGKKIIQTLIEKLRENNVDWIGLIAQPGTSSFYKELGFELLKDHVPLRYKD